MNLNCTKSKIKRAHTTPTLFTKAPRKSYTFSEKHAVYAKDIKQLPDSLPAPRSPNRSKLETVDISEYVHVDDRAIRVPLTTLNKPIEALVDYLVDGYEDDISKVRVIYRWLTNQPIRSMQVLTRKPKNKESALYYLWLLQIKKQRYAKVFSTMCRYAGLYCVIVHGAVKGILYQIGDRVNMDQHYGEWNAVCLDGEWRFIDALWGACDSMDPGDGHGRFACDERFFLTDPKDLIFTHFAESPRWQLLESPRHIEAFEEAVCLKNMFFELGMQVLSHPLCEILLPYGELDILFGIQSKRGIDQRFNCYISHFDRPETKRYLTRGSTTSVPIFIHKMTESSISIKVRFPERGIFRLELVGKQLGKQCLYQEYDWIAVYKVLVEEASDKGFPKMDPIGWGPGIEIERVGLAPFNYTSGIIVAKNVQTKVRFKIVDTNIVQNMKFFFRISSTCDNDTNVNCISDKFEVDQNIITFILEAPPLGEYTLKMFARNVRGNIPLEQRREMNICNYLLISDILLQSSPLGILTEKTEITEEHIAQSQERLKIDQISEKQSEVAESIVSASNVLMDSISQITESMPNSPECVPDNLTSTETLPSTQKKQLKQTFVRVAQDLQEIPEIPHNVVQPLEQDKQTYRSPRKLKAVSSNRVVPLKTTGGDDDSQILVPVNDKSTRPATGVRRERQTSADEMNFFTALARVQNEKTRPAAKK